ncbi:hypothetical protein M758_11G113000 [Ceratodon purpureus]|nr:hypothetical protein M758_11G113000 [Ceratodon purpureus]
MEEFVDASYDWLDDESMSAMVDEVENSLQEVGTKVEVSQQPTIALNPEQQLVLDLVRSGKNVFFTGSGGTGKTLLLQQILRFLSGMYKEAGDVVITAPTGIAAIPIGGSTIHSATGIGIPRTSEDFSRMWKKPNRKKWRNAKVWIIDEISMVSAEMLEYLEQTITKIRTTSMEVPQPFGGLQVIFAGDFFQLQPVQERPNPRISNQFLNRGLAFEAPVWHRANLETVILKNIFRQGDGNFVKMLNGIRTGENPAALEDIAKQCSRELYEVAGIKPTVLYSKNKDADDYNLKELNALPDEVDVLWIESQPAKQPVVLVADDNIVTQTMETNDPVLYRQELSVLEGAEFWKSCLALKEITLKIGAQVMLLRNLELAGRESDLVNGSRGVVIGWKSKQEKLVALQRKVEQFKSADGPKLKTHPEEAKLLSAIGKLKLSSIEFIPIVAFRNGRSIECDPELFEYPILNVGECRRLQVPLKLAWAITIHKCQGMTLDYVKVYLKDIFAEGQVYVALSRARSMNGLQVIGHASRSYVKVNPKVVEFYKALARKEVHPVPQLRFPDLVLNFSEEAIVEPVRKCTSSTSGKPFEKCPEKAFWDKELLPDKKLMLPVICYHCSKKGHPAWACTSGNFVTNSMRTFTCLNLARC